MSGLKDGCPISCMESSAGGVVFKTLSSDVR